MIMHLLLLSLHQIYVLIKSQTTTKHPECLNPADSPDNENMLSPGCKYVIDNFDLYQKGQNDDPKQSKFGLTLGKPQSNNKSGVR